MTKHPDIIFDAERMKHPHTGMYHYCRKLGMALLDQQPLRQNKLGFYLPQSALNVFANNTYVINQRAYHRFYKPFINDYKVWHVTNQVTDYFPWKSRKKIVLTVHDLNFLYEKKSLSKQRQYLSDIQQKVSRADVIVTISQFVQSEIEHNLKIDSNKIKVIYNGCNIESDTISVKPEFPIDYPFIFSLGAISAKKNFAVLPVALVGNDLHLVIAGIIQNKDYFNLIFDNARKHGVENRVHYIGPVLEPQKQWLMENCALFAFPSLAEGFGLPVIEAMRFGKPVVLSRSTSLPEIGGDAAFYFDNFQPDHIKALVPEILAHFTEKNKQAIIDWSYKFDWKKSATAYWNIYEEICNG